MDYAIDLTDIIISIVGILLSLASAWITSVAVPWLKEKRLFDTAKALCGVALTIYDTNEGSKKFNYVYAKLIERYGKYFDEDKLKEAVQSAYVALCTDIGKAPSKAVTDIK
jgi:hypothetical protein